MTSAAGADRAGSGFERLMVTVAAMMATTVVILDMTIASIALPHMQGSLGANQDQIAWVMTIYFVSQAISTACTGWIAGRIGRKRTYIIALGGFMFFSVLSGGATSLQEILIYRACQGALSAPVIPISQALMLDSYPPERHGQALAIWGTGVMFAPVMGPVVGGYLTDHYGWPYIFFVGIPFALVGMALSMVYIRETIAASTRRFDVFGFIALACALAAMQLMLDRGELKGWFDSPEIIIEAAIVILGLYIFVVHSLTTDNPFISRGILTDRNLALGLVFMFLLGVCVLALNVLLPMFLQMLRGLPILTAGLVMAPRGVGTVISLMMAGWLVRHMDGRLVTAFGFACVALSSYQLSTFSADVELMDVTIAAFLNGLGIGFVWVPLTVIAFETLPQQLRTEASTLTSLARNYGSGVGVSIVVAILSRTRSVSYGELAERVNPYSEAARAPYLPHQWSLTSEAGRMALDGEILRQAQAIGFANDFYALFIAALVTIPLLVFLRTRGPAKRAAGE